MRNKWILAALALAAGPAPALADKPAPALPARIATADFAALPLLRRPLLSPDGHQIAARATLDGKTRLVIFNADQPEKIDRSIALGETNVAALRWAGNRRLLLTIQTTHKLFGDIEIPILRLLAIDTWDGAARFVDTKSRGIYAGDVLYTDPTGNWALVASQNDTGVFPSVKRVDLATGDATLVEKARENVWDWYADDQGVVRAGIAYEGRRWTVWYRNLAGEPLKKLKGKFAKGDDGAVDRMIFGADSNAWIVTNERTGRFGLYRYNLDSGAIGETLFENPEVDLEDVTYDRFTGKIIAISYQDDRSRTLWLDPKWKALQQKLDRALPDSVNTVVDWSDDKLRYLVWSGGGADPGTYFLLDRKTSKMHPVVDPYQRIDPTQLAPVKPVRYQSRDGLSIPGYLTLPRGRDAKGLPLIVMPHGGPFMRDEWTYDPMVQFLANRGYAVFQPQFRGSTGYGKNFVTKGYGEFGKGMQDDLDDGVDWLVKSGQVDPKRVCIVGMSYGGYAALWGAVRNPERYRCAASWAGVSDLRAQLRFDRKLFSATRYFREWRTMVGGEGKIDLGAVSPISFAGRFKVPVLIGHGEKDETVPPKQSHAMVQALTKVHANVTPIFYKDSSHDFGSTADFNDFLQRLEQFLAKNNPA
jgi:dipeptidyl aminopeptidase/acylaminoacyl peptidase